jgi:adenosylcobyric acid synthase
MVQGTTSDAGKSLLVAALCRIFVDKGFKVAPFKSQNMALNSFATEEGHEIGRAQALQAAAARIKPTVHMNPILLKPTDSSRAQVIVRGKVYKNLSAREYHFEKTGLLHKVEESLDVLRSEYDLVFIEGAGSPAEINLKKEDIANMRIAKMAQAPVLLVGDIDRGGVFAQLVGTLELLDNDECDLVKGLVINKFRGDITLLDSGIEFLEERTAKKVLGVVPYMRDLKLDSEDSLALDTVNKAVSNGSAVDIAVIRLPHISNFTDIDTFSYEPGVNLRYVTPGAPIGETDLLIIPGTKNTMEDMQVLHEKGMVAEIRASRKKGAAVVGVCGGYQMLGSAIEDEHGMESDRKMIDGIGLLDCVTSINPAKVTVQVEAEVAGDGDILTPVAGCKVTGYEIHMGVTRLNRDTREAFRITRRGTTPQNVSDGCVSADGMVFGTYIHGIFDNGKLRKSLLDFLKAKKGLAQDSLGIDHDVFRQTQIDLLAKTVSESLDIDAISEIIGV